MGDRSEAAPWVWVLAGIAAPGVIFLAWLLAQRSETMSWLIFLAGLAFGLGALIIIPTRSGAMRTVAHAVGTAVPLIPVNGEQLFDQMAAISAGMAGMGLSWLVASIRGKDQRRLVPMMFQSFSAYVVYVAVVGSLHDTAPFQADNGWGRTLLFVVAIAAAFLFEMVWAAAIGIGRDRGGVRFRGLTALKDLDSFLAITGAGALFALSVDLVGAWAFVVSLLPYSFTHTALSRFGGTQTTYEQTLRALAQIPEAAGHAVQGHALEAAALGRQVALDLGLTPGWVDRAEHACLMHEVGLVALNESGIVEMGYSNYDIARWGAEILAETSYLGGVAADVRRQYDPLRIPGGTADPSLTISARIVLVVGTYLRMTEAGSSPLEALAHLQAGTAETFDSNVVAALRERVERTRGLRHPVGVVSGDA